MTVINSVLGPLDTADLGFTLPHEHVMASSAGIQQVYPEFVDREGTISEAVADLKAARGEGVRTMVDVTTFDLGRDIRMLEQVSRESGMQMICATGIWRDIPRLFWDADPDAIAPLFVREIEVGIEDTGIKAGIIKVANDAEGVTPEGEVILRAVARAHKATGAPITTHAWAPERVGEQQIAVFEDEGVDLRNVCIGHSNDTRDLEHLAALRSKGVWIGLDRLPGGRFPGTPKWEERVEIAKGLIDAGFTDQLILSHDWVVNLAAMGDKVKESLRQANPDRFLFITRRVLPRLREMGIGQDVIDRITIENPRRFLAGAGGV